jgi:hypothetical protein
MYALGVNLSRHRSACLLKDGRSPIAICESSLTGRPDVDWLGSFGRRRVMLPEHSIGHCLSMGGIDYVDLDVIVFCDVDGPVASRPSVADCVLRLPFSPHSRLLTVSVERVRAFCAQHTIACGGRTQWLQAMYGDELALGAALYGTEYEQSSALHH